MLHWHVTMLAEASIVVWQLSALQISEKLMQTVWLLTKEVILGEIETRITWLEEKVTEDLK